MKTIISILSVAIIFLAAWNYKLSANQNAIEGFGGNSGLEQKQTTEDADIEATIKSMADSTEKVWEELVEIKTNDIVFLNNRVLTIRKDLASLLERQDKIAQEQYDFFNGELLRLNELVLAIQKEIVRLHDSGGG